MCFLVYSSLIKQISGPNVPIHIRMPVNEAPSLVFYVMTKTKEKFPKIVLHGFVVQQLHSFILLESYTKTETETKQSLTTKFEYIGRRRRLAEKYNVI